MVAGDAPARRTQDQECVHGVPCVVQHRLPVPHQTVNATNGVNGEQLALPEMQKRNRARNSQSRSQGCLRVRRLPGHLKQPHLRYHIVRLASSLVVRVTDAMARPTAASDVAMLPAAIVRTPPGPQLLR